jgi:hypothetical protein
MKTLEEKNRMIVEFMGHEEEQTESGEFVYAIEFQNPEKLNDIQVEFFCAHEFKYHISWDWLMPVIQEIKLSIEISDRFYEALDRLDNSLMDINIQQTYENVVDIIEWYNENK